MKIDKKYVLNTKAYEGMFQKNNDKSIVYSMRKPKVV